MQGGPAAGPIDMAALPQVAIDESLTCRMPVAEKGHDWASSGEPAGIPPVPAACPTRSGAPRAIVGTCRATSDGVGPATITFVYAPAITPRNNATTDFVAQDGPCCVGRADRTLARLTRKDAHDDRHAEHRPDAVAAATRTAGRQVSFPRVHDVTTINPAGSRISRRDAEQAFAALSRPAWREPRPGRSRPPATCWTDRRNRSGTG